MILNPFIYQSGGGSGPILLVTVTGATPSSVTAAKSGASVSLAYDSAIGKWWAVLPSTGTWTVTAYRGSSFSTSTIINANNVTVYEIILQLSRLPSGYTELDYLQGNGVSGGAYIDTGLAFPNGVRVVGDIVTPGANANVCIYGVYPYGNTAPDGQHLQFFQNVWRYSFGNALANTGTAYSPSTKYSVDFNSRPGSVWIKIDDVPITLPTMPTVNTRSSNNFYLFYAYYDNGPLTVIPSYPGSLYEQKLYESNDDSNIVADFVPAKRDSDSMVGMYDIVRNSFFTNAGTGAFIAGPEI